jgi:hypothetical protein
LERYVTTRLLNLGAFALSLKRGRRPKRSATLSTIKKVTCSTAYAGELHLGTPLAAMISLSTSRALSSHALLNFDILSRYSVSTLKVFRTANICRAADRNSSVITTFALTSSFFFTTPAM